MSCLPASSSISFDEPLACHRSRDKVDGLDFGTTRSAALQLPDEIIAEILDESSLSKDDLYQLCLVSRRVLPFAQRNLYRAVSILTWLNTFGKGEHDIEEWSNGSLRLWMTLTSYQYLRRMVRIVRLDTWTEMGEYLPRKICDRNSGVSVPKALATFVLLNLLPDVRQVTFRKSPTSHDFTRYSKLDRLSIDVLTDGHDLVHQFPHLNSLTITSFFSPLLTTTAQIHNLRVLDLGSPTITPEHVNSLVVVGPSIESLRVNVKIVSELDLSLLPHLSTLHLYEYKGQGTHRVFGTPAQFFEHLAKAPELKCLSVEGCIRDPTADESRPVQLSEPPSIEDRDGSVGNRGISRVVLRKVTQLRIENWFKLDIILAFLYAEPCEKVRQLVVPAIATNVYYSEELKEIKRICSSREIELYYTDGDPYDPTYITERE